MAEDLNALAGLVYQRARSIETAFARLRAREFATKHFETFAKFPQGTAAEIRRAVPHRLRQAAKPGVKASHIARILRRYGQVLGFVHESLDFVLNAEVLSIPVPFVLFLEELASNFLEPRFVLQGAPAFNYSFMSVAPALNGPLDQAGLKPRLTDGFAIFRFPAALREDGLQHCILAHELGHYVDDGEALWRQSWLAATAGRRVRIERYIRTQMGTVPRGISADLTKEFIGIYVSWIMETVCDLIGSRILGPAYLFSAVEFLRFSSELRNGSRTHPPPALRLWVTYDELRSLSWQSEIDDRIGTGNGQLDQMDGPSDSWHACRRSATQSIRALSVGAPSDNSQSSPPEDRSACISPKAIFARCSQGARTIGTADRPRGN
jgi:hypothetical protein